MYLTEFAYLVHCRSHGQGVPEKGFLTFLSYTSSQQLAYSNYMGRKVVFTEMWKGK